MYNRVSFYDYYRNVEKMVSADILKESDDYVIGANVDELVEYYFRKYSFENIVIDETREENIEHKKYIKTIPAHEREHFYQNEGNLDFECQKLIVMLPIISNIKIKDIMELQSSTFSLGFIGNFKYTQESIIFEIEVGGYRFFLEENQVIQAIKSSKDSFLQLISWKNTDINNENSKLQTYIRSVIVNRIDKIKSNKNKIESLIQKIGIPLKQKQNQGALNIQLSQAPLVQKIINKPTSIKPVEYVLDSQKVQDIISFLDNQGMQFEKTPQSYKALGEEELRDILLVNLNSIFEGKATGETFSGRGKTDIYLNIDKGNILVFECKIWGGEKLYHETIAQLGGYLTWRHNFGIVINFARNKNFSSVVSQMESIITKTTSFISGFRKVSNTHFVSRHKLSDEEDKDVEIHHLLYNLYC